MHATSFPDRRPANADMDARRSRRDRSNVGICDASRVAAESGGIGGPIGGSSGGSTGGKIGAVRGVTKAAAAASAAPSRPRHRRRKPRRPRRKRATSGTNVRTAGSTRDVRGQPEHHEAKRESGGGGGSFDGSWSLAVSDSCGGHFIGTMRIHHGHFYTRNANGSTSGTVSSSGSVYAVGRYGGVSQTTTGRLSGSSGWRQRPRFERLHGTLDGLALSTGGRSEPFAGPARIFLKWRSSDANPAAAGGTAWPARHPPRPRPAPGRPARRS